MNIFILEKNNQGEIDWAKSAKSLDDMRVVKMITETNQIICTVLNELGYKTPYKSFNPKHPSILWAGESLQNLKHLVNYNYWLCREYETRFKKVHAGFKVLLELNKMVLYDVNLPLLIKKVYSTPIKLCMPEEFKSDDAVESYRNYYLTKPNIRYVRGSAPEWFKKNRILPYVR